MLALHQGLSCRALAAYLSFIVLTLSAPGSGFASDLVSVRRVSLHQVNVNGVVRGLVLWVEIHQLSIELAALVILHVPEVACAAEASEATAVLGSTTSAPERSGTWRQQQQLLRERFTD